MKKKIGTLMFNAFTGALASVYVGKDKEEKARLGIRLGGALEYLIPESFWSVRLEMAPILYLSGSTAGGFQGGIGVVYYFDNPKIVKTSNPSIDDDAGESAQKPDFDEFDEFNDMSGTEDSTAKGSMVKPRSIREESNHPAPRQKKTEVRGGSGENGSTSSTRRKGTVGEKRKPTNQPRKVETKSKSRISPKRSKTKDTHKSYRIEKFLEDKGHQNSDDIEL